MSKEALLLKTADMIHNVSDLLRDVREQGDVAFFKFNASKEEKITHCMMMTEKIEKMWLENPLIKELREKMNMLSL